MHDRTYLYILYNCILNIQNISKEKYKKIKEDIIEKANSNLNNHLKFMKYENTARMKNTIQ